MAKEQENKRKKEKIKFVGKLMLAYLIAFVLLVIIKETSSALFFALWLLSFVLLIMIDNQTRG